VRFSDILRETLHLWAIPESRANLQRLVMTMVQTFGTDALAAAIATRVQTADAEVVILDGIRRNPELAFLRQFPSNTLVYVTAPAEVRFERLRQRRENIGEGTMSYEQFLEEERAATEVEIPQIGTSADIRIVNDKGIAEYEQVVRDVAATVHATVATSSATTP
jgi:dephospho-CoA kinase